ncbi:MAG TPA: hypothetical protein VGF55_31480 [Gemmataceae bacterium]|jgi:hypothetical protein
MRRRRLFVVAASTLLALGLVWWVFSDPLSADERALVGAWRLKTPTAGRDSLLVFRADRTCTWTTWAGPGRARATAVEVARWSVRGGRLVLDYEPNMARRLLRPIGDRIGVDVQPVGSCQLRFVMPDEFVFRDHGSRELYTRAPAD